VGARDDLLDQVKQGTQHLVDSSICWTALDSGLVLIIFVVAFRDLLQDGYQKFPSYDVIRMA
jgi:hypothetical protein